MGYGSEDRAWAAFTPQPNTNYQIQPGNVFYLLDSEFFPGQLIDVHTAGRPLKIDFSVLDKDVKVIQERNGELIIVK